MNNPNENTPVQNPISAPNQNPNQNPGPYPQQNPARPEPNTQKYRGKFVTSIRNAVTGDPGFKGDGRNDQVVITTADSHHETTVLKSEITPD